jgi:ribosomal protein S18 acetylase RimI-like enzyme
MTLEVSVLPDEGLLFNSAIHCYSEAFSLPPYSDPKRGEEVHARLQSTHKYIDGFQAFIATDPAANYEVIGMCYGYKSKRGQWWHDTVKQKLTESLLPIWFDSAYELVEIAVQPKEQGRGIGTLLINYLLDKRTEPGCVLSTRIDSQAHELYERLGFSTLGQIEFNNSTVPYYIMGKTFQHKI